MFSFSFPFIISLFLPYYFNMAKDVNSNDVFSTPEDMRGATVMSSIQAIISACTTQILQQSRIDHGSPTLIITTGNQTLVAYFHNAKYKDTDFVPSSPYMMGPRRSLCHFYYV
jgi:hypothetical protein